jgi:hypothetical protein
MEPVNMNSFNNIINNDQSPFYNITPSLVTPLAFVPIAFVSNIPDLNNNFERGDTIINLEPINLTFEDFITLFYYNTGYQFNISPSNSLKNPVTFLNQFYNTTPNNKSIFSLYDQFIKAWTKKTNKASSSLSFIKLIKLQREVFLLKGLYDLQIYSIGKSYDEILSYLLATSNIKPVKHNCHNQYINGVPVEFIVQSKIFSQELDVILYVNFRYNVVIPGFTTGDIITEVLPKKVCKEPTLYECDNSSLNSDDLPPSLLSSNTENSYHFPESLLSSNTTYSDNTSCEFSINIDNSTINDELTIIDSLSTKY